MRQAIFIFVATGVILGVVLFLTVDGKIVENAVFAQGDHAILGSRFPVAEGVHGSDFYDSKESGVEIESSSINSVTACPENIKGSIDQTKPGVVDANGKPDDYPLPLSALGLNPDIQLSDEQLAIMQSLVEEFLCQIDGSSPRAGDKIRSVKEREIELWQAAQQINDERFRSIFGDQLFTAQQIYRAQQEHLRNQGGGT